ncbi:MAG TPA: hypothetical protein VK569_10640 [Bacteroidota bacterium]|nr:hypothetical protein [Bacteroidota bacterium]
MESNSAEFTPLGAYQGECRPGARPAGNVIKSGSVTVRDDRTVSPVEDGEPDILVHRDGDRIEKIEFTCRCGRTSAVTFDYD